MEKARVWRAGNHRRTSRVKGFVLSIRQRRRSLARSSGGHDGLWPAIVAVALTGVSFTGVVLAMPEWQATADAPRRRSTADRIVFFVPRATPPLVATRTIAPERTTPTPPASTSHPDDVAPPVLDTATGQPVSAATPNSAAAPASPPLLSPLGLSPRLVPSRPTAPPWYSLPRARNPFAPPVALSREERDSALSALSADVPALAAQRVQPESERDAADKEAMLKIHLSGRALLVPPDNSGGLVTGSLPLPFFGTRAKARRTRDSKVFEESQARLRRLRERADSARRARGDSLPR